MSYKVTLWTRDAERAKEAYHLADGLEDSVEMLRPDGSSTGHGEGLSRSKASDEAFRVVDQIITDFAYLSSVGRGTLHRGWMMMSPEDRDEIRRAWARVVEVSLRPGSKE